VNLRRRDVLLRVGLAVATALVLCAVLRGWDPPMPYRTGYTPLRDIVARVSFADPAATKAAYDHARSQVRFVYVQAPEPLVRLRTSLGHAVSWILAAESYDDLRGQFWAQFQPMAEGGNATTAEDLRRRFERFRQALGGEEQLAQFQQALAEAFAPFEQRGLLYKLAHMPGQGNQQEIAVHPVGRPDEVRIVGVGDVLIADGGAIQKRLAEQPLLAPVADELFAWIRPRLRATLTLDQIETDKAQEAAVAALDEVVVRYQAGQTLAKAGKRLTSRQIELLRLENEAALSTRGWAPRVLRATAVVVLLLALLALEAFHLYTRHRRLLVGIRRLAMMLGLVVLTVILARWAAADSWQAEIVPLLLLGQMVAIAHGRELALAVTTMTALIVVLALGLGLPGFLVLGGITAVAILQLAQIRNRTKLIYVGVVTGAIALAVTLTVALLDNQPLTWTALNDAARNARWALVAGFLIAGLLPFVERGFGALTDISLLDLADVAHPLMQELVRRAPSTYNHSITVGSIAEAAADAIGARGLLVRVGAHFHDIGKMLKPGYFIENQDTDVNRHEALLPTMSCLVIIAHVKDGVNLGRQHRLPQPIIDMLQQHHGTTLVEFFYERAHERQQSDPNGRNVEETIFRYPGPKPQTKEAGVLMLADAVESASRTLVDPTPARIQSLVRHIAERRLEDGQFDESGLTLRELRTIENSLTKSLTAIYHGRVKYPDQKPA
jgi:putative nucleotidyltransferase with HDIG domain